MSLQPVLIAGEWRAANANGTFRAENPATGEMLPEEFPISTWADCDAALAAATDAAAVLRETPPEKIAEFLTRFAERIEARAAELVEIAHRETALPKTPRLAGVEIPRTTSQLRQAAAAALTGDWALPVIDAPLNLRSVFAPVGPVLVFGPNNFPFAFNGISGGDFASAIAAGNPVIAKAHPCHPGTTRRLAEEALAAVKEIGLPPATVQMIYHLAPADGLRFVADKRMGAIGFTGSRAAGLKLKAAADAVGKPIYLEMSSINPVLMLPGALAERGEKIAEEYAGSCLMAGGQFCTSPGLAILFAGADAEKFIASVKVKLEAAAVATLLSTGVAHSLAAGVDALIAAGAEPVTGGAPLAGNKFANTFLRVAGEKFLAAPEKLFERRWALMLLEQVLARLKQEFTAGGKAELFAKLEPLITGEVTPGLYAELASALGMKEETIRVTLSRTRRRFGELLRNEIAQTVATPAEVDDEIRHLFAAISN